MITGANRGIGRRAVALPLDVGDTASFDTFVSAAGDALRQTWERETFDFLVNNGGMSIGGSFADVTEEDFDRLVDVHFKGVFFRTQKLSPPTSAAGVYATTRRFKSTSPRSPRCRYTRRASRAASRAARPSSRSIP